MGEAVPVAFERSAERWARRRDSHPLRPAAGTRSAPRIQFVDATKGNSMETRLTNPCPARLAEMLPSFCVDFLVRSFRIRLAKPGFCNRMFPVRRGKRMETIFPVDRKETLEEQSDD